jgi:hypothetical protein
MTSGGNGAGGMSGGTSTAGSGGDPSTLEHFSFFVTSLKAMRQLSGSQDGFGGDLRFGTNSGLEGADKICTTIAESSMPGSGAKEWHAFLSTEHGGAADGPIHAKDRIGTGPWYDRTGRVVSMNLTNLLMDRPSDADADIKKDLPNEEGVPNKRPDPTKPEDDTHHFLTGSDEKGECTARTTRPASAPRAWIGRPRAGRTRRARKSRESSLVGLELASRSRPPKTPSSRARIGSRAKPRAAAALA